MTQRSAPPPSPPQPALQRRLGLVLLVLYGVGITVGAGIYVLIGTVAGHAGVHAPLAFALAAVVMALTVGSYAELATRYPVSAGEAAYLREAYGSRLASTAAGLLTVAIGIVSAAAVALGSAGYLHALLPAPRPLLVVAVVLALGAVAAWGILQSVVVASVFTLVEVGGLVMIILAAVGADLPFLPILATLPPADPALLSGLAAASLLAFFAFIGFEDLANVAEEAKDPHRTLPLAMALTLVIATVLYVLVAAVAVSAVPPADLAASEAPLSLVFQRLAGTSPATIGLIAVVATLNTVLAQMTMVARVVYGMARLGDLPAVLGRVHGATGTPLVATAAVVAAVIALALSVTLERLAVATSMATLLVFALVNLALIRLKRRGIASAARHATVPFWVPVAGLATCLAMAALALLP
jgi:APA family basic amino acid/polyamine antiporter